MNILFIAQRVPYPANKGEKIRSFNQIKFLAELGHHIHVISPIEGEYDIQYNNQLAQLNNISCSHHSLSPKPFRLLKGLLKNEPLSVANFYSRGLQVKIDKALKEKTFDAIICTSSAVAKYLFSSCVYSTLVTPPKLIMDYMDLDSDKWQQYAAKSRFPMKLVYQREAKLISKYEVKIQKFFDACFFIADAEVNLFKQTTGHVNNVHTLGNGMNTEEFYPATPPPNNPGPKFIFTGVMDYKPNVDAVVWFVEECWRGIIKHYPDAEFIIAGMNPNLTVLNLKKYPSITITGFVDDILPFYHKADYFIAPFRLARGVQNKVLQAFACGLPVISTSMGAEGINCRNNQEILLANTSKEFIEKVLLLEQNKSVAKKISSAALSLIKKEYTWQGKLKPLQDFLSR